MDSTQIMGGLAMQDEQALLEHLTGKFFSFHHDAAGTKVICRDVPPDFTPNFNFGNQLGTYARPSGAGKMSEIYAKRAAAVWTPERVAKLIEYRSKGLGAREIMRLMGISRWRVQKQIYKMEVEIRDGVPFQ